MNIPKAIPFSFPTTLTASVAIDADSAQLANADRAVPDLAVGEYTYLLFCSDNTFSDMNADYEIVKVDGKTGDTVSLAQRGVEVLNDGVYTKGAAKAWDAHSHVMCPITAQGWLEIRSKLDELDTHQNNQAYQAEIHGLRIIEGSLEFYDGTEWNTIDSAANWDGGEPGTNYGGFDAIDGGSVS